MRGISIVVVLAGCIADGSDSLPSPESEEPERQGDPAPSEIVDVPRECDHEVAMYGMGSSEPTIVGPLTLDAAGVAICLELDARDNLWIAHFAAGTNYQTGSASSFELGLYDADGNMLRQGWDVTVGSSPPRTFANLEYGMPKGDIIKAMLHVRAPNGTATSDIALHLFEPYE